MKINQPAVAGTLESGDVMIRIAPLDTQDIDLQINSSVEKQFGDAIRTTILDVLARYNVRGVQLNVDETMGLPNHCRPGELSPSIFLALRLMAVM